MNYCLVFKGLRSMNDNSQEILLLLLPQLKKKKKKKLSHTTYQSTYRLRKFLIYIHPHSIWIFRIANADMTTYPLGEFGAREEPKDRSRMDENMFPFGLKGWKFWDAWELISRSGICAS